MSYPRLFALHASLDRKPAALFVKGEDGEVGSGLELDRWVHAHLGGES